MTDKLNIKDSVQNDIILKEFWRDNARFADLFNAVIFNGRQIISPDELQELDTDISGTISMKNYSESIKRTRDVVKKMCNGVEFNILGLELQDKTHYAMPLRTMVYDALGYIKEYNELKKLHKSGGKTFDSSESFLSGINKDDRFHPIITIVLYYGESPWDGPVCLSDMMYDMPDDIRNIFSDYRLNLVQILDSNQYKFYNDDVKAVFNIARSIYTKDMQYIYNEYAGKDIDTYIMKLIAKITSYPRLMDICEDNKSEGGEIMPCKALLEMFEEQQEIGMAKGIEQCKKDVQNSIIQAIQNMLDLGLTKEQILTKYTPEEFAMAEKAMASK